MSSLLHKVIVIFAIMCYGSVVTERGVEEENDIIKSIMNKIEKIAEIFSKATIEEKPKILSQIQKRLKTAAAQSFGVSGSKYVDIIMEGVKLKAMNSSFNVSLGNGKGQSKFDKTPLNKYESEEHLVKTHVAKTITDKIESFAKKHLIKLNTIEEKRVFLENVRRKMLQLIQVKINKSYNDDVVNYDELITNSVNDILHRNLQQNARRAMSNIKDGVQSKEREFSTNPLQNNGRGIDIVNNNNQNLNSDTECTMSVALICAEVNTLNKFTCPGEDRIITVGKVCDGVEDCANGTDESDCHKKAVTTLNHAKNSLFEMNESFEQDCLLGKFNESIKPQEIIRDWIKAQIDVIDDYHDVFQYGNESKSNEGIVKKAVSILNKIILNLNSGVCMRQHKSIDILERARRFYRILDENLDGVLRESALFPKSCVCVEDRCVSRSCVKSCDNACNRKYSLGRWSCPAVNGSTSVPLNIICDGKLDCYDESDERDCNIGKGRGKFDANEGFTQIIKLLEMKMASKENEHVRNELLRLYNSIISLQQLISESKFRIREIKVIRDRCFALLSLIYGNFMKNGYNSHNAEEMYRFLNLVNHVLIKALKSSHTGNSKIILTYDCICRSNKCIKPKCSPGCILACEVENKLSRFYCKSSLQNRSIPIEEICDGKIDCVEGDDEADCSEDICRRHHLYILRTSIQDVGKKHDGTKLGEALKFWRMKATSMLLVAEKMGRRSPQFFRVIIRDMLKDLIHVYASYGANRKKNAKSHFKDFTKISKNVMKALKYCGKYFNFILFSFPFSSVSGMFRWLDDDTFDCVVGIAVDNSPVSVGTYVNDRLIVTSANPLSIIQKHRIKIFAINGNPESSKVVNIDYITVDGARQAEWVRIGSDRKHNTRHDIILITVTDGDTTYIKHQTLPRRPYYLPLAGKNARTSGNGWQFAAFGFASKRHVKYSNILKAVTYRDQVLVDCTNYLPPAWGKFICIRNLEMFAGIQSGAPLIHKDLVYGIGSFSYTKDNESLLVFTDVRPYRGKLVYLYTRLWWWG